MHFDTNQFWTIIPLIILHEVTGGPDCKPKTEVNDLVAPQRRAFKLIDGPYIYNTEKPLVNLD